MRSRKWEKEHKDKQKEYSKKHYELHKEEEKERNKKYKISKRYEELAKYIESIDNGK